MAQLLLTQRGNRKLIYNGYGYVKRRETGEHTTWACDAKTRTRKCPASAKTVRNPEDGAEVEVVGEHNHEPVPSKFQIVLAKNLLKQKAMADTSSLAAGIIAEVAAHVPSTDVQKFLKEDSMRRFIQRYRAAKRPRDPDFDQLTRFGKNCRRAMAAANTKRAEAAQLIVSQTSSRASEVMTVQDILNKASDPVAWLEYDPSTMTPVQQPNDAIVVSGTFTPTRTVPIDETSLHNDSYDSAELQGSSTVPTIVAVRTFRRIRARIGDGIHRIRTGAPVSNRQPELNARPNQPTISNASDPSQGTIHASVQDLVRVMEACRTKSPWDSFGEYVARTLEALPPDVARQTASDVQNLLFRVQDQM